MYPELFRRPPMVCPSAAAHIYYYCASPDPSSNLLRQCAFLSKQTSRHQPLWWGFCSIRHPRLCCGLPLHNTFATLARLAVSLIYQYNRHCGAPCCSMPHCSTPYVVRLIAVRFVAERLIPMKSATAVRPPYETYVQSNLINPVHSVNGTSR